jgi:hypothetical protein
MAGSRVPGKHTKFPGSANSVGWRAPPPGGLRRAEPLHLDFETVSIDGSPHARTAQAGEQTRLVVESTDENPQEYVEHRDLGAQYRGVANPDRHLGAEL